eukprot:CAMPEP_0114552692 /NCGR_PEP_ID=MMETSP0114-20121206/7257_1 /TAXON_ID=31324 /ORGANISM="Goniomonas sp, Strain m" /LENGTH=407 /DNA_ID=CAMNT_0001737579 /DNA_START=49 /DNA_END=1272 /DNA_ORIENTATION=+
MASNGMVRCNSRGKLVHLDKAALPRVRATDKEQPMILKKGTNCFIFIDQCGREVPVWYNFPVDFNAAVRDGPVDVEFEEEDEDAFGEDAEEQDDPENQPGAEHLELGDGPDEEDSTTDPQSEGTGDWEPELVMDPGDNQIVFVCHGVLRNADEYCRVWRKFSNRHRFLLLCPEFGLEHFPEVRNYQLGNMFSQSGKLLKPKKWSFTVIEDIFKALSRMGVRRNGYSMYGHSAGAQFVHRLVQFMPKCHVETAVSANPGWYTMPSLLEKFPYGWRASPNTTNQQMELAFSRGLVVLLGQEDTKSKYLRQTDKALAQGPTRLQRGLKFFETAMVAAAALEVPLSWALRTVPGVGHSNKGMAGYGVQEMVFNAYVATEDKSAVGAKFPVVMPVEKFDPADPSKKPEELMV